MYKRATSGKRKRVILISCLSMLLAACGGGGGGDSQVTVTATAGTGGSITPASQSVIRGSQVTLTVQPEANYSVQSVTGCDGTLEGNTYRTGAVNANCTVRAGFVIRPFEASISGLSESVDEGSSGEFVITPRFASGAVISSVTTSVGGSTLALTKLSETSYRYTAAETDRDLSVTLSWTVQDGADATRQQSGSLSVNITNSSFAGQLAGIKTFADNYERLLGLDEEKRLVTTLKDMADVLGHDASFNVMVAERPHLEAAFANAFDMLLAQLNAYLAGQSNDTALQAQFDDALARFSSYASTYKQDINSYLAMLPAEGMTPVTTGEFYINSELGTVSLFTGNTGLGAVQDGVWVFNHDVAYLDGLLANTGCAL